MRVLSIYKNARISAFKCRDVARAIQGRSVVDAINVLSCIPKKAARLFSLALKSAVANAENNNSMKIDGLVVHEASVGEGRTSKRFRPKARGSAGAIRKRTAHLKIVVSDNIPEGANSLDVSSGSTHNGIKRTRARGTSDGLGRKSVSEENR